MNRDTRVADSMAQSAAVTARVATVSALVLIGGFAGCQKELFSRDMSVPPTAMDVTGISDFEGAGGVEPGKSLVEAVDEARVDALPRQEQAESIELSLAETRAAAIEHNFSLKVELFKPRIGITALSAAEAAFEAVIFGSYTTTNESLLTQLEEGIPTDSDSFSGGVRLPLVTGGSLEVSTLGNRSDGGLLLAEPWEAGFEVDITQPLLRDAGIEVNTAAIRIARYDAQTIDAQTKLSVIRLLSDVERAYWNLYRVTRVLDVRVRQYEVAKQQAERARRLVAADQGSELDVLRAESGLGGTLESVIVADNAVRVAQRDLKVLMNRPDLPQGGKTRIVITDPPSPTEPRIDSGLLVDRAMSGRMELLELELSLAADAERIMVARNGMLPSFVLDYNYQVLGDGTSAGNAYSSIPDEDIYSISFGVEIPVGNEAARSTLARTLLTRLQRLQTKNARKGSITNEVLDAADGLTNAWQRIIAARLESELAARTLAGEQRQFDVGLRTSTDVLDAAARLADAQASEVNAMSAYQIAFVDLAFATGTTLGAQRVDIPDIGADALAEFERELRR